MWLVDRALLGEPTFIITFYPLLLYSCLQFLMTPSGLAWLNASPGSILRHSIGGRVFLLGVSMIPALAWLFIFRGMCDRRKEKDE